MALAKPSTKAAEMTSVMPLMNESQISLCLRPPMMPPMIPTAVNYFPVVDAAWNECQVDIPVMSTSIKKMGCKEFLYFILLKKNLHILQ